MPRHTARSLDHRPVLLIVGCGDVGLRVLRLARAQWRVLALTSSPARCAELRAAGATPLVGNLDAPATLARLAGLADAVLHLAPPPGQGREDPRTAALLQALSRGAAPRVLVYGSTSGVYGDCAGAFVPETRPVAPRTDRAWRRVDAERQIRAWGRRRGARVALLRIPGIYAPDREGGRPQERVQRGSPLLRPEDDGWTNHIHADDLARACLAALARARTQRAVHVSDDGDLKTGDWYDSVADALGLPRVPRLSRDEARRTLSPMQMSFLDESRRLLNGRLHRELRLQLRWPTIVDVLAAGALRLTR